MILSVLKDHGEEAYAVGGCVRDALLGRKPSDWDITTSASPETVRACFRRTIATGIEHGTVTVMIRGTGYEVTTYRIDGAYGDHRHPDSVTITPDLSEDLKRRDFTVNAMAYTEETGVVDLFHGLEDLEQGIIRAVGDPYERFSEDALRIVRSVRFAAKLGFRIDPETYRAAEALADTVQDISRERVREELLKILESPAPEFVNLLRQMGILQPFYPEYGTYAAYRTKLLSSVPRERIFRLSAFFAVPPGTGEGVKAEAAAGRVMDHLKFDRDTRNKVLVMLRFGEEPLTADCPVLRRLLSRYGTERIRELVSFHGYARENADPALYQAVEDGLDRIEESGECISLKMLAVTGDDLKALGFPPGRSMGAVLEALLDRVLETPSENTKERLLAAARELADREGICLKP